MILNTGDNLSISAGNCYVHCTLYTVHCTKADRTPTLLILIVSHLGEIQYRAKYTIPQHGDINLISCGRKIEQFV